MIVFAGEGPLGDAFVAHKVLPAEGLMLLFLEKLQADVRAARNNANLGTKVALNQESWIKRLV